MPKIFKRNKLALLSANIFSIILWISFISLIINFIDIEKANFYVYKLFNLIKFLPPLWLTYYLWIVKKGFK